MRGKKKEGKFLKAGGGWASQMKPMVKWVKWFGFISIRTCDETQCGKH